MIVKFEKLKDNSVYSNNFFAWIPRINIKKREFFWLCTVHKEIIIKNGAKKIEYSKCYDGYVYFSELKIHFNENVFFNKFAINFNF